MKIEVTAEDIERGQPCAPFCCPVARALLRTFAPPACLERTDRLGFYVRADHEKLVAAGTDPRVDVYATTPDIVIEFMKKFDNDKPVEPFSFTIDDDAVSETI
jgi:hypothetical protein